MQPHLADRFVALVNMQAPLLATRAHHISLDSRHSIGHLASSRRVRTLNELSYFASEDIHQIERFLKIGEGIVSGGIDNSPLLL